MARGSFKNKVKPNNTVRWDDPFKEDLIQISTKARVLRYFPYLIEVKQHYIEIMSETKGRTGFPTLCLAWDPVNEQASGKRCPWCELKKIVLDKKTKEPKEQNRFYASSYFYGMAFDRGVQRKTKDTVVGPVRMTKTLAEKLKAAPASKYHPDMLSEEQQEKMLAEVEDLDFENLETLPDVTDEKWGFDVTVLRTEKNNKIDYDANPGNTTPLTDAETEAFEAYEAATDIAKMAWAEITRTTPESIDQSIERLTSKFINEDLGDKGGDLLSGKAGKKPDSQRLGRIPKDDEEKPKTSLTGGDDDDDDDTDVEPTPPPKKPASKPAQKEAPKPTPVAAAAQKKSYSVPAEEDDDDGGSLTLGSPDADDIPDDDDE